jgi:hypothetical protein
LRRKCVQHIQGQVTKIVSLLILHKHLRNGRNETEVNTNINISANNGSKKF